MSIVYRARASIKSSRPLLCVRKPRPVAADCWPSWTDRLAYAPVDTTDHSPAEVHEDTGERLSLADLIDREIRRYESWGSEAGDLLAGELATLRREVELTCATTVAELEDRRAALSGVA